MSYDVERIRSHFPALRDGAAHFDGPGGTQTPDVVAQAVADTLVSAIANRGHVTAAERRAEDIVAQCRLALADLLGTDARSIVFGRSATQLTYDFSRTLAKTWAPGDEIVVSRLDHDSNIRPWIQAAEAVGATVRWADFDAATGAQDEEHFTPHLNERTRLVALTAASNLIGTRPPVTRIAALAHAVGALVWVDGVHATAHTSIDLATLGADFVTCSPYKLLGPHCGVVAAARPDLLEVLRPDKLLASTDEIPERFEFGTLPYELMAGTTAAVDFLAGLADSGADTGSRRDRILRSYAVLESHEEALLERLEAGIRALPGVTVHSNAPHRTPTLLFSVDGIDPQAVSRGLAEAGVNAPAGHFYALECSRHLGLGDEGAVRVGLAPYTDDSDVDRLLTALSAIVGAREVSA
ncbi:MAG TPA: cysteine desulfurase-like protein, partial [Intrasporangiaceae bacterium]|nr:cysteine desulfurase-like protein [Intrasporangiaceae bacterium]